MTLNTGSQWDTTKTSLIDTLSINSGSVVNVGDSTLISDTIGLTGGSALKSTKMAMLQQILCLSTTVL